MKIGLSEEVVTEVSKSLFTALATTYALYLKTQNFHWNVKGDMFISLHLLFQKHYEELAEAIDEIAEKIASLDSYVDASFLRFNESTVIKDSKKKPTAKEMIKELLDGHETLIRLVRPLASRFQELQDDVSSDLMIKRLTAHEKAAWMLRALL